VASLLLDLLKPAELMLAPRIEQIRKASVFGIRPVCIFRGATTRFLEENTHLATLRAYAFHLKEPDPYMGDLPLYQVHMGTLQAYIDRRKKEGKRITPSTAGSRCGASWTCPSGFTT
jgi:hypothetical protein